MRLTICDWCGAVVATVNVVKVQCAISVNESLSYGVLSMEEAVIDVCNTCLPNVEILGGLVKEASDHCIARLRGEATPTRQARWQRSEEDAIVTEVGDVVVHGDGMSDEHADLAVKAVNWMMKSVNTE